MARERWDDVSIGARGVVFMINLLQRFRAWSAGFGHLCGDSFYWKAAPIVAQR